MSIPFAPAAHFFMVTDADWPVFEGRVVHAVCSTYALAREFEWAGRRVYLASRPEGSEAIGTQVEVRHKAPAQVGDLLCIEAVPTIFEKNWLICTITAHADNRLIAEGSTTQKLLFDCAA